MQLATRDRLNNKEIGLLTEIKMSLTCAVQLPNGLAKMNASRHPVFNDAEEVESVANTCQAEGER